jgi:hypothetical protein
LTNPLTKLAKKALGPIVRAVLTSKVRAAAEGKLGDTPTKRDRWKRAYWWAVGKKTGTGILLLVATVVLAAFPDTRAAAAYVGGPLATLLVAWGLLDKAWRNYRPAWLSSPLARFAAAHPAEVGAAFTAAFTWQQTQCVGAWCPWIGLALVGLAAVAVLFGFLDAAWKAPAPREL